MYRLIITLGLLSLLILMGLLSSLTYSEKSYDLKTNNIVKAIDFAQQCTTKVVQKPGVTTV